MNEKEILERLKYDPFFLSKFLSRPFRLRNLVTNGGMEDGDPPTGWADYNTAETRERSGVQKYSGNYSLHIVDSVPSFGGTIQPIQKIAGKSYALFFRYHIVSGSIWGIIQNGDQSVYLSQVKYSTTGSWQAAAQYATEDVGGALGGPIFINSSNAIAAEFYIDDVWLSEW